MSKKIEDVVTEKKAEIGRRTTNVCADIVPQVFTLDEMASAKAELNKSGLVVFCDAISEDLQKRYTEAIWAWIHFRSGGMIRNDDHKTWGNRTWPNSYAPGIQSSDGLCHLPEAWEIRESTAAYFEGVYSDPNLLVSFDGANIMRPTTGPFGSAEYMTPRHWLHVDSCGRNSPEHSGYQGVVNVSGMDDTNGSGGCFQAVLGSHTTQFEAFMEKHKHGGLNYTAVPEGHALRGQMSRILAPDRSLIIWKNELFRCNSPNCSSKFRFAQYVNFCPSTLANKRTAERRLEAFEKGIGSTHWVHQFSPSCLECPVYEPPQLTHKQEQLLGKVEDSDAGTWSSRLADYVMQKNTK
eukprot:CAMPEP_0113567982 /NCGR_PEP_ID=MMETSP0015_2-20120614/23584_1 /TAXON_ID=2838 /ORGANISM="Odontella" /LENGTH=350 /DNA_ID=CAMNT_0000470449 /DNA_START=116 /DNA_END=1171 /DNA_ORIENTATION=+ /assembly_acc=CAM_ASM_000160